ncbi:NUDIX hydrolase [Novosphingobium album (ex Liu et al. 2023)]|uniref:NUDIX domain-containing protein n=1 Tax=Novosphingobium album (ex Liu et al. 2023) TaxID=3031130 RepID=A0ABT5WJQ1_9SPHN|nr:NUDIX domain-containing protein [Novosphingobium album (ex Liu et al. 2023)]MDE8650275.1 NUDIX domain-containing protein [Novosphingobium album (ex Liu et al. 2023)]
MLHLIPPPLHRALYRFAFLLRAVYWRLLRPTVEGCRIVALDGEGRVLLIRQSYGTSQWQAPSGGMARGEDPLETASRELFEEAGCTLERAREVARLIEHPHGAHNIVHVVVGRCVGTPRPDHREVCEAGFFALAALPADLAPRSGKGLHGWVAAWQEQEA